MQRCLRLLPFIFIAGMAIAADSQVAEKAAYASLVFHLAAFFESATQFSCFFSLCAAGFPARRDTNPWSYYAATSLTMRTKLLAVARKRKSQSTRFSPRSLSLRIVLLSLPQPKTISTSLRFF